MSRTRWLAWASAVALGAACSAAVQAQSESFLWGPGSNVGPATTVEPKNCVTDSTLASARSNPEIPLRKARSQNRDFNYERACTGASPEYPPEGSPTWCRR